MLVHATILSPHTHIPLLALADVFAQNMGENMGLSEKMFYFTKTLLSRGQTFKRVTRSEG